MMYLHLTLVHSKGQSQGHANLTVNMSQTVTDWTNIAIANTWEDGYWGSVSVLHLTLAHSKGPSQGHINVDSKYLVNDE